MVCPYCSSEVKDNSVICSNCAADLNGYNSPEITLNNRLPESHGTFIGMKWYKFLVFILLLSSIFNFVDTILYIAGNNLGALSDFLSMRFFEGGLRFIDILFAVFCLVKAVAALFIRKLLVEFKENGPKFFIIYEIVASALMLAYDVTVMIILDNAEMSAVLIEVFGTIIGEILYVYLNCIYFKKRKHLFVNK